MPKDKLRYRRIRELFGKEESIFEIRTMVLLQNITVEK